jgi:hypothetical protein
MIRYLDNNEIDDVKWNKCVNKAFNGNPYALTWFLDLIHDGWGGLVQGDYERIMPITPGRKFGIDYLFQPYFAQQLGVFSTSMLSPEVVNSFISAIPGKYQYIDIKLNSHNQPDIDPSLIFPNKNHVLDLINDYHRIGDKYSTQTKRNLKKVNKHNLSLMKNIRPESLINLFRVNKGRTIGKWKEKHYMRLRQLMYVAVYKGKGMLYGVFTDQNELCAGAFFLKSHNRLIFLFSGSNQVARENGAMTFLIDSVIQEYTPSKLVLDFEGSNDPNLARFYKGFGAKEIDYPGLRINRLNFPARQVFSLYQRLKNR